MVKKKTKSRGRARAAAAAISSAVLIVLALTVFIYRDYLTPESLGEFFGGGMAGSPTGEPFTFEPGSKQSFALAGNGLAIVSESGMQLLSDSGLTVSREILSFGSPAVAASKELSVFYDIEGVALRVFLKDGQTSALDTENPIISVTANGSGWFAVVTELPGYKGGVMVYNSLLNPVYEWLSGDKYILSARIAPDCKSMAVLCAGANGGGVSFFTLDSVDELVTFESPGELFIDLYYIDQNTICAISENRAVFLSPDGEILGEYSFGDMYLADYNFGGNGFLTVFLGKYRSGNEGVLITVDSAGQELGRIDVNRDLLSISSQGNRLAALYSDCLVTYTKTLESLDEYADVLGVRDVFLRPKGDALLISSFSAQIYNSGK